MIKRFPLGSVRYALLLCSLDQQCFGGQLPLLRKIAPLFSGDGRRVVWGY